MTATVIGLAKAEVPWSRHEHGLVVGKDILELLSSSMYVDPMAMYREYIQNAADAIDLARTSRTLDSPGVVRISIDAAERTIWIRDNGTGLNREDFPQRLIALGGSKKRGTLVRGFRGVGRLAGLAFAQDLIFRSRQHGERTVHELRWSGREVRARLRSMEPCDLHDIVASSVLVREISGERWPEQFFEVELRGVVRHRDDRLLDHAAIFDYLSQIAPVPFHPDFRFADQIRSLLQSHGVPTGSIEIDVEGLGRVYRPHRNSIRLGKSGETKLQELTTVCTPGRDGGTAAITWLLHSNYLGALPSASLVEGWRFRVGDIQIGHNDLMVPLFPESRFNSWCVAETHVVDCRILPNGRRDHFEQNSFYFDLINHLAPHAREIGQRCRTSSIHRNLIRRIETEISDCERRLKVLAKPSLADSSAAKLAGQIEVDLAKIEKLAQRSVISPEQHITYQARIRRLRNRVLRTRDRNRASALDNFTPVERKILGEVLNSIYGVCSDIEKAQDLVDRIMRHVSKTLGRGKARKQNKRSTRRGRPVRRGKTGL